MASSSLIPREVASSVISMCRARSQHLLFAEAEDLGLRLQLEEAFQHLGDTEQAAVGHLLTIFFEAVFPVRIAAGTPFAEELNDAGEFAVFRHLAEPKIAACDRGTMTVMEVPESFRR